MYNKGETVIILDDILHRVDRDAKLVNFERGRVFKDKKGTIAEFDIFFDKLVVVGFL
jgi:hypothetical protein